jgi:hypothetical protein
MIRCENLAAVLFFSLTGLDLSLWAVGKGFFLGLSSVLILLM